MGFQFYYSVLTDSTINDPNWTSLITLHHTVATNWLYLLQQDDEAMRMYGVKPGEQSINHADPLTCVKLLLHMLCIKEPSKYSNK